jgi:PAS domain-containing protein
LVQLLNLLASHLAFRPDIPQLNVILDKLTDYTIVEVSGFQLESDGKPVMFLSSRNISERKLTERALLESEERYRLLFVSSKRCLT